MAKANALRFGALVVLANEFYQAKAEALGKFKASAACAASLRLQRKYLARAKEALATGDTQAAKAWLTSWKLERGHHANLLAFLGSKEVSQGWAKNLPFAGAFLY